MCVCSRGIGDKALVLTNIGFEIQIKQGTYGFLAVVDYLSSVSPVRVCDISLFEVSWIVVY